MLGPLFITTLRDYSMNEYIYNSVVRVCQPRLSALHVSTSFFLIAFFSASFNAVETISNSSSSLWFTSKCVII